MTLKGTRYINSSSFIKKKRRKKEERYLFPKSTEKKYSLDKMKNLTHPVFSCSF